MGLRMEFVPQEASSALTLAQGEEEKSGSIEYRESKSLKHDFPPQNTAQKMLPPVASINTYVQPWPGATSNKI